MNGKAKWFRTMSFALACALTGAVACVVVPDDERTEIAEERLEDAVEPSAEPVHHAATPRDDDDRGLLERFFGPEEQTVVVPAGTILRVALGETLSSHDSVVGQAFDADVLQGVTVDGVVAIPTGARVFGEVTEASPARKIGGRARLSLGFLALDFGESQVPISASISQVGKSQRAKDAAIIGGSTIAGAVLGEAVDEGEGGVIGAIVGGLAGTAGAKKTKGKPIVLAAGSELSIRLETPIEVTVRLDT